MPTLIILVIIKVIFLISLGVHLLQPNKPCQMTAGVTALILAVFILFIH